MPLDQEIDRVFARLDRRLIEPEVAGCAIEQLVCAHLRLPPWRVGPGLRAAIEGIRAGRVAGFDARTELVRHVQAVAAQPVPDDAVLWL